MWINSAPENRFMNPDSRSPDVGDGFDTHPVKSRRIKVVNTCSAPCNEVLPSTWNRSNGISGSMPMVMAAFVDERPERAGHINRQIENDSPAVWGTRSPLKWCTWRLWHWSENSGPPGTNRWLAQSRNQPPPPVQTRECHLHLSTDPRRPAPAFLDIDAAGHKQGRSQVDHAGPADTHGRFIINGVMTIPAPGFTRTRSITPGFAVMPIWLTPLSRAGPAAPAQAMSQSLFPCERFPRWCLHPP